MTRDAGAMVREQLREHWVLALATAPLGGGGEPPYSAPLFYAVVDPADAPDGVADAAPLLVFASKPASHHGGHLGAGPVAVSAAVFVETEDVAEVRGLQFRGEVVRLDRCPAALAGPARSAYLARHPAAAVRLASGVPEVLYALCVTWAKVTDNRLGFGVHPEARFAPPPGWPLTYRA